MYKIRDKLPSVSKRREKRKRGSLVINDLITFCLVIFAIILLINSFSAFFKNYNRSQAIKSTTREFMERMETVGYLSANDQSELIAQLTSEGVSNIRIEADTTKTYPGYGNQITLHYTGDVNRATYTFNGNGFSGSNVTESDSSARVFHIDQIETSTCKMITAP